jgi:hypothetical protein
MNTAGEKQHLTYGEKHHITYWENNLNDSRFLLRNRRGYKEVAKHVLRDERKELITQNFTSSKISFRNEDEIRYSQMEKN